jgi:hypothetical protein
MTTTPTEPGGTRPPSMGGMAPGTWAGARMPIPGNAEFAVYFLIELIFALIWIVADSVDTRQWVLYTTILTAFYVLSRGIAKASRVLEQ